MLKFWGGLLGLVLVAGACGDGNDDGAQPGSAEVITAPAPDAPADSADGDEPGPAEEATAPEPQDGQPEPLEGVADPPDEAKPDEQSETQGSAQDDSETEPSEEELLRMRDDAFVDYSRCVRDEGFSDFPDIDSSRIVDQGSAITAMQEAGVDFTQPGLGQALQACASVFSEVIALAPQQDTNAQQVEEEENALAFSQCMRDRGLDNFPDPDFGRFPDTGFDNSGSNAQNITPEVRAALDVCLPVIGGAEPNLAATP